MKAIAIIGLGVIGASLGMALHDASPELEILGADREDSIVERALQMEAITGRLQAGDITRCRVVFIATPLGAIPQVLNAIRDELAPGSIVSDVGSAKTRVMQLLTDLPDGVGAIGGHPMAGSDRSGIAAADRYLLQNAVYVLTPGPSSTKEQVAELQGLIELTGAQVIQMPPAEHDRMVARVSHLPHLTAACLMNNLEGKEDVLRFAAGGLRDTTRVAASSPDLWTDILLFNREAVLGEIDNLIQRLATYRSWLEAEDTSALRSGLAIAREVRARVPVARTSLANSADIIALVPDQPGVIGHLGKLMGNAGININDIQIMGVREEDEGAIRLGVPRNDCERALAVLQDHGIKAWARD